jgi:hypothetical protein
MSLFFRHEKEEYNQKMISKLIGSKIMGELEALQFLSKHFSHHHKLPVGWRGSIIEKTLYEKFGELLITYQIKPIQEPKIRNIFSKFLSKIKIKK